MTKHLLEQLPLFGFRILSKMHQNIKFRSLSLICVFAMGFLCPVKAARPICAEYLNPLNFRFDSPREKIVDYQTFVDIDPVGFEFLEPEDVVCDVNFEKITVADFQDIVVCIEDTARSMVCTITPQCTAHRKQYLHRLKSTVLRVLDEAVLKIKAVNFFNKFLGAKKLIFGTERIGNLTGIEIISRATTGRYNLVKGCSVSSKLPTPTFDDFKKEFGDTLDLYLRLLSAEPTGLLRDQRCSKMLDYTNTPIFVKNTCTETLFSDMKRNNLPTSDMEFLLILERALDSAVSYLSGGSKRFTGRKIPFTGPCVTGGNTATSSDYGVLVGIVEQLKAKRSPKKV